MTEDAIEIREFRENDLDAIVEFSLRAWQPIFASVRNVLGDDIFLRLHPDWKANQADAVRSTCTNDARDVFVAEANGRPVGFVAVALNAFNERMGVIDMLGIYGQAVQRSGYRDAKLRTLLETIPDTVGPGRQEAPLTWADADGELRESHATVVVSNNAYRLGRLIGSGRPLRPHLDEGLLGIIVIGERPGAPTHGLTPPRAWREWTARSFQVGADERIAAGIDGEAARLEPPLSFRTRPQALKVRIARTHPEAR